MTESLRNWLVAYELKTGAMTQEHWTTEFKRFKNDLRNWYRAQGIEVGWE